MGLDAEKQGAVVVKPLRGGKAAAIKVPRQPFVVRLRDPSTLEERLPPVAAGVRSLLQILGGAFGQGKANWSIRSVRQKLLAKLDPKPWCPALPCPARGVRYLLEEGFGVTFCKADENVAYALRPEQEGAVELKPALVTSVLTPLQISTDQPLDVLQLVRLHEALST